MKAWAEKTSVSASPPHCDELILLYGNEGAIVKGGQANDSVRFQTKKAVEVAIRNSYQAVATYILVESGTGRLFDTVHLLAHLLQFPEDGLK